MAEPGSLEFAFQRLPWWVRELLWIGAIVLIGIWLFATEVFASDLSWQSIRLLFEIYGPVWAFSCLFALRGDAFLHELGHALAATIVGYPVRYIQMGYEIAREPRVFYFLGYKWIVHSFIRGSGLCHYGVRSIQNARLKMAWIIAAGPLVDMVILYALFDILYRLFYSTVGSVSTASPALPFYVLFALLIFRARDLLYVLKPREFRVGDKILRTDVLLLLNIWGTSDETIKSWVETDRMWKELPGLSLEWPLSAADGFKLAQQYPGNAQALYSASTAIRQTMDAQYLKYLRTALDADSPTSQLRILILDEYLTGLLDYGLVTSEPRAEEFARELVSIHEDKLTARGTEGSILVDLGRVGEGTSILAEVLERSEARIDKTYAHIFLALAEKSQGRLDRACAHAQKAIELDANCTALHRIADLEQRGRVSTAKLRRW